MPKEHGYMIKGCDYMAEADIFMIEKQGYMLQDGGQSSTVMK